MRRRSGWLTLLLPGIIALASCGGSGTSPMDSASTRGEPLATRVADLPLPPDVTPADWAELKAALAAELELWGAERAVAAAPAGEHNKVGDFRIVAQTPTLATFGWTYRNLGDYDQNGEVNIADLTPIGIHFGDSQGSPTWTQAEVADGDNNGEVNIADVTRIGQCFLATVSGYSLETSASGAASGAWTEVTRISLTTAELPPAGGFLTFTHQLSNPVNGNFYRVAPYHDDGSTVTYGPASDAAQYVLVVRPENLVATQGELIDQVRLDWDAVTEAQSYLIHRADVIEGTYTEIGNTIGTETTYTDGTVDEGVHYWYKVAAELPGGESSSLSTAAEGWSNVPPQAPQNVSAGDGTSAQGIVVSWTKAPGANEYNVYRETEDNLIATLGDESMYLDESIADTDPHTYWVSGMSYGLEGAKGGPDDGYLGTLVEVTGVLPLVRSDDASATFFVAYSGGEPPISFEWNFGGGCAPNISTDEGPQVQTADAGTYGAWVDVTCKAGTVHYGFVLEIYPGLKDLLVVYNSHIQESLDLAEYYMSPNTGRSINSDYWLGLPLGETETMTVSRADYETTIRDPIKTFLDDHSNIKNSIKYILLLKGVPHKIQGENEFSTTESTYSSVDSELCLLYEDGNYPTKSWIWNDPDWQSFGGSGFYLKNDTDFQANFFRVSDVNLATYTLNYLVGRLSAYTYAEAKLLVDRSLAADTSGAGWTVLDSCGPRQAMDTMVDPVWPWSDPADQLSGEELLTAAGFSTFADVTSTRIISTSVELPGGFVNSLIGYAGWGVNHSGGSYANGNEYILKDLGWTYLPGACFMSYESFNGTEFDDSDGIQRRGQGQICDFFRMGGSVAIGNVWEPFTIGVGDERWVFDRYIHHGDRWIEAAYKGLRLLSWQEVVVGDPLCRVVAN